MTVVEVLEVVRLLVFAVTAMAGVGLWVYTRDRSAALLAVAFGVLLGVLGVSEWLPESGGTGVAVARDLVVVGLAAFPWLVAAFAWSFEPGLPLWLRGAAGWIGVVAVWVLVLPPLAPAGEPRSAGHSLFVLVFVVGWSLLTVAAAVKLWRAGGAGPLIRARMRTMAVGVLMLTTALLLVSADVGDTDRWQVIVHGLTIVSALLFTAAFAPPRALRMWWRRRATGRWQQVQSALIAAVTPPQVAEAVVPMMADVLGAGVAVIGRDHQVLAASGLTSTALQELPVQAANGPGRGRGESWVPLDGAWLVVTATAYTPLFGSDEQDIIAGNSLQLRLALERAELFERNEQSRRELEQEQEHTQAMLAGLAHDLRGPVGVVGGFAELLRDEPDPAIRDGLLDRIDVNLSHLSALAGAVVQLARAGYTHTDRVPVDLSRVVSTVAERVAAQHPSLRVHTGALPTITADPLAMEQVFENLLSNAARHTDRDDPTVTVHARREGDTVLVDVVDNGPGIPAADRDLVFAPFHRGRAATTPGSGIGLGLVRRILDSHEGQIQLLDSTTGTHFRLEVPAEIAGIGN